MNLFNKTKAKFGQAAVETLMILGIALVFIIPLVLIFYSSTTLKIQTLNQMQAKAMAQHISDTAGEVWYEGYGARRTILVNYPDGIMDVSLSGNEIICSIDPNGKLICPDEIKTKGRDIVLTLDDSTGGEVRVIVISPAPVKNIPAGHVAHNLNYLERADGTLNPGSQVLIVKNEGQYVNIVRFVPGVDY
ncbi:MAG: hypothetical protein ABIH83_01180 [Candidatus Micrarchaeota archaeon]